MKKLFYTHEMEQDAAFAALAQRVRAMPKVEIHIHLEGSMNAATIYEMALRNNIGMPAASLQEWISFYRFRDFDHFIQIYIVAARSLKKPEDYVFMLERFCEQQARQNIVYSEAFLSTSLHLDKMPDEELIQALAEGVRRGRERHGVQVRIIPDIARNFPDTQKRVLEFALKGFERGIFIGLGLGGSEIGYPPGLFVETFAQARKSGLRVVAHAGETGGPEVVRESVALLKAERIGHGIRTLEDAALTRELAVARIPFEVSPTSNYRLKVAAANEPHPIRRMMDAGLMCTVNSDDPPMFGTDLNNEYLTLAAQGFSWDELWRLNLNGLEATFLPREEKKRLHSQWDEALD